jgi:hypothetical protein
VWQARNILQMDLGSTAVWQARNISQMDLGSTAVWQARNISQMNLGPTGAASPRHSQKRAARACITSASTVLLKAPCDIG